MAVDDLATHEAKASAARLSTFFIVFSASGVKQYAHHIACRWYDLLSIFHTSKLLSFSELELRPLVDCVEAFGEDEGSQGPEVARGRCPDPEVAGKVLEILLHRCHPGGFQIYTWMTMNLLNNISSTFFTYPDPMTRKHSALPTLCEGNPMVIVPSQRANNACLL